MGCVFKGNWRYQRGKYEIPKRFSILSINFLQVNSNFKMIYFIFMIEFCYFMVTKSLTKKSLLIIIKFIKNLKNRCIHWQNAHVEKYTQRIKEPMGQPLPSSQRIFTKWHKKSSFLSYFSVNIYLNWFKYHLFLSWCAGNSEVPAKSKRYDFVFTGVVYQ